MHEFFMDDSKGIRWGLGNFHLDKGFDAKSPSAGVSNRYIVARRMPSAWDTDGRAALSYDTADGQPWRAAFGYMTYCLGLKTREGLVLASDSRTNAGMDQVNVCRKLHTFAKPGERVLVVLTSGSLSVCQSVMTLIRADFDAGHGLAEVPSLYDAARYIGDQIRKVADLDREALERDKITFNPNLIVGGQIRGGEPDLYLIYPQGNPLRATEESPYLQIGETKYGRPILDRGLKYERTTLEEAVKYALISLDSTMQSNVTVGPPLDVVAYERDAFALPKQIRLAADDPQLRTIHQMWEQSLRQAVQALPRIEFG